MSADPEVRLLSRVDTPRSERLPSVMLHEQARDDMDDHVSLDTSVESGGVLVGRFHRKSNRVMIAAAIPATKAVGAVSSLTFTHEAWDEINDRVSRDFPDEQIVGWYHSHPHFGIFLSEYDLFIHRNFFAEPWQVAYVVDPLLGQAGFFGWQSGEIERMSSWYVRASQSARMAPPRPSATTPAPLPAPPPASPGPKLRLVLAVTVLVVGLLVGYLVHQPSSHPPVSSASAVMTDGGYRLQRSVVITGDTGTFTLSAQPVTAASRDTATTIYGCAPTSLTLAVGNPATRTTDTASYACPIGRGASAGADFVFRGSARNVLSAASSLTLPRPVTVIQAEPGTGSAEPGAAVTGPVTGVGSGFTNPIPCDHPGVPSC